MGKKTVYGDQLSEEEKLDEVRDAFRSQFPYQDMPGGFYFDPWITATYENVVIVAPNGRYADHVRLVRVYISTPPPLILPSQADHPRLILHEFPLDSVAMNIFSLSYIFSFGKSNCLSMALTI